MLISDDFVVLNYPKTGSSFVRKVIKELYRRRAGNGFWPQIRRALTRNRLLNRYVEPGLQELILPNAWVLDGRKVADKHASYFQIPIRFLDREVVSVVRNPFSRFLSTFEFRWWATNPAFSEIILKERFPKYPNLSLDEYVDIHLYNAAKRLQGKANDLDIGNQTIQFIQFFFKEPRSVLESKLSDDYFLKEDYRQDIGQITFLKQESLNVELHKFLSRKGFSQAEIAFIKDHDRVNVTKSRVTDRSTLWTRKALDYVSYRERYLLKILDDLGMDYQEPNVAGLA